MKWRQRRKSGASFACIWIVFCLLFVSGFVFANGVSVAYADTSITTGVTNLEGSYTGSASWDYSQSTITGRVNASSSTSCGTTTYTSRNGTLTLKNNYSSKATLSFNYGITLNSGTISINGAPVTSSSSFSLALNSGANIKIVLTSNSSNADYTDITISNISLTAETTINVTFLPVDSSEGSYTYRIGSGSATTVSNTQVRLENQASTNSYTLAASPKSGYRVGYWLINEDKSYYLTSQITIIPSSNISLKPVFLLTTQAVFAVGSSYFLDLNDADNEAKNGENKIIIPAADAVVPSGNYTISSGVTLLIPFDSINTLYTTEPAFVTSMETPSAFRTLTFASGATLTVNGSISIPSKLCAYGQGSSSYNGCPTGKHGKIVIQSGGSITLNSGARLYCWGFISGGGTIIANSGSHIYECFQNRGWRGGTATLDTYEMDIPIIGKKMIPTGDIHPTLKDNRIFPFNMYYVQNIECKLQMFYGAKEYVKTGALLSSYTIISGAIEFIGSGGFFALENNATSFFERTYLSDTGQIKYVVSGNAKIQPMSITLTIKDLPIVGDMDATINTTDFDMPLTCNMMVEIKSGTTTVEQTLSMLPLSQVNVLSGATLKIASGYKVYLYDNSEWGDYAGQGLKVIAPYYDTVNGTTSPLTASSLKDASINNNGTIDCAGGLYTTSSGGDIWTKQGTGTIKFSSAAPSNTTIYQVTQSNTTCTAVSATATSAKLHNADASYVATSGSDANTTYVWCTHRTGTTANDTTKGIWDKQSTVGWNEGKTQYHPSTCGDYATGFYHCPTSDNANIQGIHDFNAAGFFQSTANGVVTYNGSNYFVLSGIVQASGLHRYNNLYYPVDQSNHLLSAGVHYLSYPNNDLGLLDGYYTITENGYIQQIDTTQGHLTDSTPHIVTFNNAKYYARNGIAYPIGLFADSGNYYYAKTDGSLAVDQTYYASKTNKLYAEGNYYFDSDGHLYSASFTEVKAS